MLSWFNIFEHNLAAGGFVAHLLFTAEGVAGARHWLIGFGIEGVHYHLNGGCNERERNLRASVFGDGNSLRLGGFKTIRSADVGDRVITWQHAADSQCAAAVVAYRIAGPTKLVAGPTNRIRAIGRKDDEAGFNRFGRFKRD